MKNKIMGIKEENKKQDNKKTPAPKTNPPGKPECKNCGRRHAGECEERKCEYCMADPTRSESTRTSHFSNQCNFKFPERAPPHWKRPAPAQEQEREGAIRKTPTTYGNTTRILQALQNDRVCRIENTSHRQVLSNGTYLPEIRKPDITNITKTQAKEIQEQETKKVEERKSRWDNLEKKQKQAMRKNREKREEREKCEQTISRAVDETQYPKTMAYHMRSMEENYKLLVRVVRGPAIQRGTAITFIDASSSITGDKFNMHYFVTLALP